MTSPYTRLPPIGNTTILMIAAFLRTAALALACAALLSCNTANDQPVTRATWLLGTWEYKSPEISLYETWRAVGSNLEGRSIAIQMEDTVLTENMEITQESDSLCLIATVGTQNNGKPVRFVATTIRDGVLVFDNPAHDFLQKISYTRVGPDSLVAEIWGNNSGHEQRELFPMKKVTP